LGVEAVDAPGVGPERGAAPQEQERDDQRDRQDQADGDVDRAHGAAAPDDLADRPGVQRQPGEDEHQTERRDDPVQRPLGAVEARELVARLHDLDVDGSSRPFDAPTQASTSYPRCSQYPGSTRLVNRIVSSHLHDLYPYIGAT